MKKGFALLLAVILTGALLALGVMLLKIVYNSYVDSSLLLQREQAFWLAEAWLEQGKVDLNQNPNWYSDLPHAPEDDSKWIKTAAVGERDNSGKGQFKIVREKGKNYFYSVGARGQGTVVFKLKFSLFPYKSLHWEEI